jgi:hypothetical protein
VTKTIRIPDEDYAKIREYAEKRDIPMSAALSQYLNVVENLRGQLPDRQASTGDRGPTGPGSDVDDWATPDSVVANVEQPAADTAQAPPANPTNEVTAAIEELTDRVATLEDDLETLAARVRKSEGNERE